MVSPHTPDAALPPAVSGAKEVGAGLSGALSEDLSEDLSEALSEDFGAAEPSSGLERRALLRAGAVGAAAAAVAPLVGVPVALAQTPDPTAPTRERSVWPEAALRSDFDAMVERVSGALSHRSFVPAPSGESEIGADEKVLSVGPVALPDGARVTVSGVWVVL